jgi:hypothetical protein
MIIFVAVLIAVVILAVTLPGSMSELRSRRRSRRSIRDLPVAPVRTGSQADWWPDFERQFRAYVREHEREAH